MNDEESIPLQPKAISKPMKSIESSYGAFADVSMSLKDACEFETPGNQKYQHPACLIRSSTSDDIGLYKQGSSPPGKILSDFKDHHAVLE